MSNDYWIVVKAGHAEHDSEDEAVHARALLERHHPGAEFKVVRCKRFRKTADHFPKLVAMLVEILECAEVRAAMPRDLKQRVRILLTTVRGRREQGLRITRRVPEFEPRRPS